MESKTKKRGNNQIVEDLFDVDFSFYEEDSSKRKKIEDEDENTFYNSKIKWKRNKIPIYDPEIHSLSFQQMDSDYIVGESMEDMLIPEEIERLAIIRMWGVTESGNSVAINIYGFLPYFYVECPFGFKESDCELFKKNLNKRMEEVITTQGKLKNYVFKVEIVIKSSIMGYNHDKMKNFLLITLILPKHIPTCRTILESGFNLPGYDNNIYQTYESDIPFVLRYMIDKNIVGGCWIEIPPGFSKISEKNNSLCQIELNVPFNCIIGHDPEGIWQKSAPLRILSFDIECAGRKGLFPEADKDPVIQISNYVTIHGEKKPIIKNIFCFKSSSDISGSQVLNFEKEEEMLVAWSSFIRIIDPDIIIGYNISNFDFPYLINRSRKLKLEKFQYLGRVKDQKVKIKDATFCSKAHGLRESKETIIEGRIQLDILQVIQREHKLRSYNLNSVATHFLSEQKEDVDHNIITTLWKGSDHDRRRLAIYCLKDAFLPQRLLDKLMILYNFIEMARVTGVQISYLLSRGQQIKVISQLYRKSNPQNYIIPCYKIQQNSSDEDISYEGATVIQPIRGFYEDPIATLDFASLYPSIMMAHNLCYTTLLKREDLKLMNSNDDYELTPNNDYFVKSSIKKGILPTILEDLLSARKKAKDQLKIEKDPSIRAVLDGRQLALKISANSVYGFTGATIGKLPCLAISASVTSYGREMIELTKTLVIEKYCITNGFEYDSKVIYGDTDSVMVKFGVKDVETAMKLGKEAANEISKKFISPIKLEFEKVYFPYLLINKKRYAGLFWTQTDKWDKIDAKGIESVRRDNCPLVKNIINNCLNKILITKDIEGAKEYVKATISELLQNKLDISLLVITKALSKNEPLYNSRQAHAALAEKMRIRNPNTAPGIGDRVPYVITKGIKGAKNTEKAEDPLYVLENGIPLDTNYYLENQLRKPLIRIFEPIMPDPNSLLKGEHTRSFVLPTPKIGGIMSFTVKKFNCLGCKISLKDQEKTVCQNCKEKESEIYQDKLNNVVILEQKFVRAWTQCQSCQGSLHQEVLCTSRDCPIFYMRKKVQKDLNDAQKILQRFDLTW